MSDEQSAAVPASPLDREGKKAEEVYKAGKTYQNEAAIAIGQAA